MEKIEKKKQKQKQNKNDQIDILRLKQSFFFPRLRAVPYLFLKFGTPSPQIWKCLKVLMFYPDSCGLCRAASKTGGFAQRIHWFCVDERLNLVKQYLTSEKSDSLGPKLSALQLWDCLGDHVEQPACIMTRLASCCVPLCTNNFRNSPETFQFAFRHVCLHPRPPK